MKRLLYTAVRAICTATSLQTRPLHRWMANWPINHEEGSAKSISFQFLRIELNNEWARASWWNGRSACAKKSNSSLFPKNYRQLNFSTENQRNCNGKIPSAASKRIFSDVRIFREHLHKIMCTAIRCAIKKCPEHLRNNNTAACMDLWHFKILDTCATTIYSIVVEVFKYLVMHYRLCFL